MKFKQYITEIKKQTKLKGLELEKAAITRDLKFKQKVVAASEKTIKSGLKKSKALETKETKLKKQGLNGLNKADSKSKRLHLGDVKYAEKEVKKHGKSIIRLEAKLKEMDGKIKKEKAKKKI